jgi:diguanylate cyclase (GGDEF)-like protein
MSHRLYRLASQSDHITVSANFRMLLDEAREAMRSESFNRRKNSPAARPQQSTPIGLISFLYTFSLFIFYQQGHIRLASFVGAAVAVLAVLAAFRALFRLGLHARFHDPALTLPQLAAALLIMLAMAYIERSTQIALVPFILIAFSFGVFRLSTASLVMLGVFCLGCYFTLIHMRGYQEGYAHDYRGDLMQWMVLALTLPGMVVVCKQIQNLRQLLKATRFQLEHYEEKSIRDELTGLFNRRQLQAELDRAKMQASTMDAPFSVCLIDIDHFKQINDGNGHAAGDKILREFSRIGRESIRDSDILGRYGGDEFLLILPNTDIKGAVMHAERLRIYAHFLDFHKILGQKHISLSIGVAQYREGERTADLLERADMALYRAKQHGRNRVEWDEEQD